MTCPQCGFQQNVESAKFCNECGAALPAENSTEPAPIADSPQAPEADEAKKKRDQKIGTVVFVILLASCGLCGLLSSKRGDPASTYAPSGNSSSPSSTVDPQYQIRLGIADLTQQTMRETGCPDCRAAVIGDILIITNPQRAPRAVASELLNHKELKKRLKDAGFTVLRVKQDTGMMADHFDYKIE